MNKSKRKLLLLLVAAFLLGSFAFGVYKAFLAPNNTVVPAFSENRLNVVIGADVITGKGEADIAGERILLPLRLVREYIDPNANWDKKSHKLTITTKDRVVRMKTGSLEAFVNNRPVTLHVPVSEKNGNILVPIEFLSEYYGIEISYNKDNNVIIVDFSKAPVKTATLVKPHAVIRTGRSKYLPIVKKLDGEDGTAVGLRVFGEQEGWYKVRASDGTTGYMEKKFASVQTEPAAEAAPDIPADAVWKPRNGKISMAWDYAYKMKTNLAQRAKIDGLDVISPTWFQVVGTDGEVANHADAAYVRWAHDRGYKVWALVSNDFEDSGKTGDFLDSTDARENTIRQLLAFAALYRLDGINIDFEGIRNKDKDALTQFVRELSPLLREQGLAVSVDINLLPCYDRKALGESADYVALMAYDQHWSGGGVAGSVSQLTWTDGAVQSFLKDIPPEKLILGMPFYTRLWKETPDGGKIKLTSKALSMKSMREFLEESKAGKIWDEESGQYYSEFSKDGSKYKVWLEDGNSLNLRTSLVHKYELAGAAAWRLDFEEPPVWDVISHNLKTIGSYSQWEQENKNSEFAYSGRTAASVN